MTNNPKNRQQWIFDLLKVESLNWTECFGKYSETFGKSDKTFDKDWKLANKRVTEYRNKANTAKEEASIAIEVEAVKSGLKAKIDRCLEKQKDVDLLRQTVEVGLTDDFYISDGQYILFQRPMTATEKATILKRASEIEAEISKIESDYAPIKSANTTPTGEQLPQPPSVNIITSNVKLSDSEQEVDKEH